jgi:hypothetical protein
MSYKRTSGNHYHTTPRSYWLCGLCFIRRFRKGGVVKEG